MIMRTFVVNTKQNPVEGLTAYKAMEKLDKLSKQYEELNMLLQYAKTREFPYATEYLTLARSATLEEINRIKEKLNNVVI